MMTGFHEQLNNHPLMFISQFIKQSIVTSMLHEASYHLEIT